MASFLQIEICKNRTWYLYIIGTKFLPFILPYPPPTMPPTPLPLLQREAILQALKSGEMKSCRVDPGKPQVVCPRLVLRGSTSIISRTFCSSVHISKHFQPLLDLLWGLKNIHFTDFTPHVLPSLLPFFFSPCLFSFPACPFLTFLSRIIRLYLDLWVLRPGQHYLLHYLNHHPSSEPSVACKEGLECSHPNKYLFSDQNALCATSDLHWFPRAAITNDHKLGNVKPPRSFLASSSFWWVQEFLGLSVFSSLRLFLICLL